jgi:hypothetical protein
MGYQVPKADHPWREYNRTKAKKEEENKNKPLRIFLTEIVESWDEVKVVTSVYNREGEYSLKELPQTKIAAWLAGILKRNYG